MIVLTANKKDVKISIVKSEELFKEAIVAITGLIKCLSEEYNIEEDTILKESKKVFQNLEKR